MAAYFRIEGNLTRHARVRYDVEARPTIYLRVDGPPEFSAVWRHGGEQAERSIQYLREGVRVVVAGDLVWRSWTDPRTHQERKRMELEVREVSWVA